VPTWKRPSINLVGRYNANNQSQSSGVGQPYIGASGRDRYIGVQVDIPFFEGFSRTYKIRTAQAQVEGKEANLADAELQVAVNVWTSYQGLKVSAENLHTSQDILESAHDAFKAAESRYQKGVANILEVLTTQTALANAQQQRIQAMANWQNARIQLAASVGSLNLSTLH
jgi:outer membrane protein